MIKYYIKIYERHISKIFPACSKLQGKLIEQGLNIFDVEGLGLSMLTGKTKQFINIATDLCNNNFPEIMGTTILINSSFLFSALWSIVKGFLDEKQINKIKIEKSGYVKKLLEFIEPENLPSFLGGTCTCSQFEGGCLYSDIGPWNPEGGLGYFI
jgi:hypothetical protein